MTYLSQLIAYYSLNLKLQKFHTINLFLYLGATFNVYSSVKEIESPLSDEIPSNLQQSDEDQKSPSAFPSFSTDKDKLSLGENIFIKSVNHIIIPIGNNNTYETFFIHRKGDSVQL